MNYQIDKSMTVIRNLPSYLKASYAREGSAAKDYALNRCLKHIEQIQKVTAIRQSQKDGMLREAWRVYLELSDFSGSERQDYNARREVPLSMIDVDDLIEDGVVEAESAEVRTGGLGYRHVNWGSTYLLARQNTEASHLGSYWQPPKKPMPCLVYTEEQIAGLNDGSLHFGDIEGSFEQIHS